MKNFAIILFIILALSGCGKSSETSDQKANRQIAKLENDVNILQQSIEMQSKQIKHMTKIVEDLKAQVSEADLGSINDLKGRIKTLEIDASGFEK